MPTDWTEFEPTVESASAKTDWSDFEPELTASAKKLADVGVNPAQYIAGGGGMAGISLIQPPGPAAQNPMGSYIPETPDIKAKTLLGQLAAAPINVGKHFVEGAVSPLGLATAGLGPVPKLAQTALAAGFGIPAIKEGLHRVYSGTATGDTQEAIEGALQTLTGGLITAGGAHGVMPEAKAKAAPIIETEPKLAPPKRVAVVEESLLPWLNKEQKTTWESLPEDAKARAAFLGISSHNFDTVISRAKSDLGPSPAQTPIPPITPQHPESPEQRKEVLFTPETAPINLELPGDKPPIISEQAAPPAVTGEATPTTPAVSSAAEGGVVAPPTESATVKPTVTPEVTQEGVPPIIGMGGALAKGEIPETGAGGEKYGVAERIRAERAKAGQVEPVNPGEGINTQESINLGRDIIDRDPQAPERVMSAFEADPKKNISAEGMAVARAQGEALAARARNIEGQFGTESRQYKEAKQDLSDWDKRSKAMQTEWHKTGMAQQGETDIDTGSFTGLERAYRDSTGKDFSEVQKPRAKKLAAENKSAQDTESEASRKLNENLQEKAKGKSTEDLRSNIWRRAKAYLDEGKGLASFDDIRNKIATDLGMSVDDVTKILASDAKTKRLADDLWNKQRNARRLKESAKLWLKNINTPGYIKALSAIPRAMFSLKVGLHGTVALGTHAPMVAFQPPFWGTYIKNFGRMYGMVFSPSFYERNIQDLVRRPNYVVARRAGLQNDPFQYEEFHTGAIKDLVKNWIGEKNMDTVDKLTSGGNRGYSVLKILRQDMFDQMWDQLPDTAKVPEMASAISDGLNHATGVTKGRAPAGASVALFAPRLAASRVMWLGGDPIRMAKTFANWDKSSVAERQFAMNQLKEKAWVFGTAASMLALNQGFLAATGSKQKINGIPKSLGGAGIDPLSSDFMKFKVAGLDGAYGSAMFNMAKLPLRMAVAILYEGKSSKLIMEDERAYNVALGYVRTQLSPFAGTAADLAFGRDYAERPLPRKMFGLVEQKGVVPKRLRLQGVKPYTAAEYASLQFSPIPISEGLREVWKGMGMKDKQIEDNINALAITSIMAATGSRVTEDTRKQ